MPRKPSQEMLKSYLVNLWNALLSPQVFFVVIIGNLIMFSTAAVFYHFEKEANPNVSHFFDAVWWAFCTVSTVGFGDIVPVTTEGRLAGIVLIVTGVCFFIGFGSAIFSATFETVSDEIQKEEQLTKQEFREIMSEIRRLRKDLERKDVR